MTKVHNFSAGPSILAESAFAKSVQDIQNFAGTGLSILEVSHRGKQFEAVMAETENLVRELLGISQDYDVLFLQGGASTQFFQIPLNFLKTTAAYTDTGTWANRAIKEAQGYGNVNVLASSKDSNYTFIPKDYEIPATVDYFHCTSNNTIYGTQLQSFPSCEVPLICDMSSDIFSRPIDANKFSMIYAGAQKNMGPAGVTLVIIRKDMYGKKADRHIPTMMDYKIHADNGSMYNTPPVFPILISKYNLEWGKEIGGLTAMEKRNEEKASTLYAAIDNSPYFRGTTAVEDRSKMNVTFVFEKEFEGLADKFDAACKEAQLSGLKGHRSVGGYRASLYNALPLESVKALVNVMESFA